MIPMAAWASFLDGPPARRPEGKIKGTAKAEEAIKRRRVKDMAEF